MELRKGLSLKVQGAESVELGDWDSVKDRILFKLVNTNINRKALEEEEIVHIDWYDMSIVFYIELNKNDDKLVSLQVTESLKDLWGVTAETIDEYAFDNTKIINPIVITTLYDKGVEAAEELGVEVPELPEGTDKYGSYILTNTDNYNGAVVMRYPAFLTALSETMKSDLYIIPGAVHEALAVRTSDYPGDVNLARLFVMLMNNNMNINTKEDMLSNNIFRFSRETESLSVVERPGEIVFEEMLDSAFAEMLENVANQ